MANCNGAVLRADGKAAIFGKATDKLYACSVHLASILPGTYVANMLRLLILLLIVLPIVEWTILFKLGQTIGWAPTILLVLGTGLAGAALARIEGWKAMMRVREQMAQGVLPAAEMFDGLLVGVAGVLLLIPGVLSDLLGLVLLVPPTRRVVRRGLMHWARGRFRIHAIDDATAADSSSPAVRGDKIIDARVIETRVID